MSDERRWARCELYCEYNGNKPEDEEQLDRVMHEFGFPYHAPDGLSQPVFVELSESEWARMVEDEWWEAEVEADGFQWALTRSRY